MEVKISSITQRRIEQLINFLNEKNDITDNSFTHEEIVSLAVNQLYEELISKK